MPATLPTHGLPKSQLLDTMRALRQHDVQWHSGRAFSLVFHAGDDVREVAQEAYDLFFAENGLNPGAFPSLRQLETDVISIALHLLGAPPDAVGNMTSGGTESLLLAVKTARDWGRATLPGLGTPEIVLPESAHPAFDKAAHYFGVRLVRTPTRPDSRADVTAMRAAMTPNTVMLVGSAPSYPHGVVDPIADIAALAQSQQRLCHVDACVGGFMLPFVRRAGYPVPEFDFQVPGVTSISADLHKYAYAAKGASVLLYRSKAIRRHQLFAAMNWPGGIYASPAIAGTRPGGAIAAAWAVLNYLGEDGYTRLAGQVMETVGKIRAGINAIPGLHVVSQPEMSVMAIASDTLDVYEVGDEMTARGWHLDRQQFPATLHLTIHPGHAASAAEFLQDLTEAARIVRQPSLRRWGQKAALGAAQWLTRRLPEAWVSQLTARAAAATGGGALPQRSAALYGMLGTLPNRGDLRELVLDLVEGFTAPPPPANPPAAL